MYFGVNHPGRVYVRRPSRWEILAENCTNRYCQILGGGRAAPPALCWRRAHVRESIPVARSTRRAASRWEILRGDGPGDSNQILGTASRRTPPSLCTEGPSPPGERSEPRGVGAVGISWKTPVSAPSAICWKPSGSHRSSLYSRRGCSSPVSVIESRCDILRRASGRPLPPIRGQSFLARATRSRTVSPFVGRSRPLPASHPTPATPPARAAPLTVPVHRAFKAGLRFPLRSNMHAPALGPPPPTPTGGAPLAPLRLTSHAEWVSPLPTATKTSERRERVCEKDERPQEAVTAIVPETMHQNRPTRPWLSKAALCTMI